MEFSQMMASDAPPTNMLLQEAANNDIFDNSQSQSQSQSQSIGINNPLQQQPVPAPNNRFKHDVIQSLQNVGQTTSQFPSNDTMPSAESRMTLGQQMISTQPISSSTSNVNVLQDLQKKEMIGESRQRSYNTDGYIPGKVINMNMNRIFQYDDRRTWFQWLISANGCFTIMMFMLFLLFQHPLFRNAFIHRSPSFMKRSEDEWNIVGVFSFSFMFLIMMFLGMYVIVKFDSDETYQVYNNMNAYQPQSHSHSQYM